MVNRYFQTPRVINRLRSSLLGTSLDTLAGRLHARGYAAITAQAYLQAAGHLSYWLEEEGISLATLSEETTGTFVNDHLPNCSCPVPFGAPVTSLRAAMGHVLAVLRETGRTRDRPAVVQTPVDIIIIEFCAYLRRTLGVTLQTCRLYTRHVRGFLENKYGTGAVEVTSLTAGDLMWFVSQYAERCKPATARSLASALRSFLRFLQMKGLCEARLVEAVPMVPDWRRAQLPKTLTEAQLGCLLSSFDRTSSIGLRDYTMTLCLAQLGLRSGEVAELSLDNINWREGALRIAKGKARRTDTLPLPVEIGQAIVKYLRDGRPQTHERRVFVRHRIPVGGPLNAGAVQAAIRRGFKRAEIETPSQGTHTLRHTSATRMVCGGASLKEVADVLRHRKLDTTAIYAQVDVPALAEAALPWPEVQS